MNTLLSILIMLASSFDAQSAPSFTDNERAALQTYWSAPGRYTISLPTDSISRGVWQVRLTADGSAWLLKYQNAIGARGVAPTVDPTTLTSDRSVWKTWVQSKIALDRQRAQAAADAANRAIRPVSVSVEPAPAQPSGRASQTPDTRALLADPGPIPASLLLSVGNPPPFASAVTPMQHTIAFDDGDTYSYSDNVAVPQAYAYYRSPQGVAVFGSPALDSELDALFSAAGMTRSEQRVARAVSKLEGSFESINTYDTGCVSVGFLQFITLDDGKHSLCEVLQKEKQERGGDFANDFHRYGIDVTAEGVVCVVDPGTGAELVGQEAVRKLVDDKRLIAVFQRAGRHSLAFRIAQIKIARQHYWPADDVLTVSIGSQVLTGKVSDVIHSEAGLATLFDRKVNRGSCDPISTVVARVMQDHRLASLMDVAQYERELIVALKYRGDFLADKTLGQP